MENDTNTNLKNHFIKHDTDIKIFNLKSREQEKMIWTFTEMSSTDTYTLREHSYCEYSTVCSIRLSARRNAFVVRRETVENRERVG